MTFDESKYKYQFTELPWRTWEEAFKPQKNSHNPEAPFSGRLFRHGHHPEWEHLIGQYVQQIWTLYEEEDGTLVLRNGIYVKGGRGHFLCEVFHNSRELFRIPIPADVLESSGLNA
jgi:hypothetical protein